MLERHWILQLLVKGLECDSDYYQYKNKEVLTQLMSLYHCPFTPVANKVSVYLCNLLLGDALFVSLWRDQFYISWPCTHNLLLLFYTSFLFCILVFDFTSSCQSSEFDSSSPRFGLGSWIVTMVT